MKKDAGITILVAGLLVLGSYGIHRWDVHARVQAEAKAVAQTADWSPLSRLVARQVIEQYGPPQYVFADRLRWDGRKPWKRIVVFDAPAAPLEQVVGYEGRVDRIHGPVLLPFNSRAYVVGGDLAARSNSEELNRLCLNLADDIAQGKRTPDEAREFYRKTLSLVLAGKSSPYMERLLFHVPEPEATPHPLAHF